MNNVLLGQVKRKLNITWNDEDTNARVEEIMDSAAVDLAHMLGVAADFDFSVAGPENTLFLSYCFYEWNHCIEEFEDNYRKKIAQTRAKHEVIAYEEGEDDE